MELRFGIVDDNLIKIEYLYEDIVRERSNCYLLGHHAYTTPHNSEIVMVIPDEPYLVFVESALMSSNVTVFAV